MDYCLLGSRVDLIWCFLDPRETCFRTDYFACFGCFGFAFETYFSDGPNEGFDTGCDDYCLSFV